jgi:hypothetical protein
LSLISNNSMVFRKRVQFQANELLSSKMKNSCSSMDTPDGSVQVEVQALMDSLLLRV